ncbi:hypothetical protein B0H16DRAFT_1254542, partial [Mycena metata]
VFTVDSTMVCDVCRKTIKVGTGGLPNLLSHQKNAKDCRSPGRKITDMFAPKTTAPLVPLRVATPPPINTQDLLPLNGDELEMRTILRSSPSSGKYPPLQANVFAKLRAKMVQIPAANLWATENHPLSIFSSNPSEFF